MDNRLKQIADNFDKMKIGADDKFMFNCTMCGKCCKDRDDILLTPKDLFYMSRELGIRINEFINKYCDVYVGSSSKLPLVRLQPQGGMRICPMLKNNKCSVHNVKPVVCAMFPIGRALRLDKDNIAEKELTTADINFIFQNPGCGNKSMIHTVREWLGQFGIPIEDEYFIKWQGTIVKLSGFLNNIQNNKDKAMLNKIYDIVFAGLYMIYDIEKDFYTQFIRNTEALNRWFTMRVFGGKK